MVQRNLINDHRTLYDMISKHRFFFESCTLEENDILFTDAVMGLKQTYPEQMRIADWYASEVKHPSIPFYGASARALRIFTRNKGRIKKYQKNNILDFFKNVYFYEFDSEDPIDDLNNIFIDYALKYKQFRYGITWDRGAIIDTLRERHHLLNQDDVTEDVFYFICESVQSIRSYYGRHFGNMVFPYDARAINFINESGKRFDNTDMENWEYVLKEHKLTALESISKSKFALFKNIVTRKMNNWDLFEEASKFKLNNEAFMFAARHVNDVLEEGSDHIIVYPDVEEKDNDEDDSNEGVSSDFDWADIPIWETSRKNTLGALGIFEDVLSNAISDDKDDKKETKVETKKAETKKPLKARPSVFHLTGRTELNEFFNKSIIDVIENPAIYEAFGIGFPEPFILEGPPGCGKTYAVEQLEKYLNLPSYHITSSQVGSPWIHETAKTIESTFNRAKKDERAIIIIDEMDAFMPNRQNARNSDSHTIEEVSSFLKCIQTAQDNHILVIGMTNFIENVDPAILRTGRMGTHIKVSWPSEEEIEQVMSFALSKLPHEEMDLKQYAAKFLQRPLSDVTSAIRKAAMTAAFNRADAIMKKDIEDAIEFIITHNKHDTNN